MLHDFSLIARRKALFPGTDMSEILMIRSHVFLHPPPCSLIRAHNPLAWAPELSIEMEYLTYLSISRSVFNEQFWWNDFSDLNSILIRKKRAQTGAEIIRKLYISQCAEGMNVRRDGWLNIQSFGDHGDGKKRDFFFPPDVEKSNNAVHKWLFFCCRKEVFFLPVDKADVLNRSPHLDKGPRCLIRAELLMRWS